MQLARYTLILHGPDSYPAEEGSAERWARLEEQARSIAATAASEACDVAAEVLPEGYRLRVSDEDADSFTIDASEE